MEDNGIAIIDLGLGLYEEMNNEELTAENNTNCGTVCVHNSVAGCGKSVQ